MNNEDDKILHFPGVRMRGPDKPDEVTVKISLPALVKAKDEDPIRDSLAAVDELRQLVERGEVEGFVIVAKHKPTGLPYTDIAFPKGQVPPVDAFFYMGVLECVKNEMADIACMAPSVLADGTIIDPEARR